ncbi:MAG: penicillin-binding protein activator LpoB, partial [Planctomycetota bacterium]
ILKSDQRDLVGSHKAGGAVWNPLVDECVAKLLGRCPIVTVAEPMPSMLDDNGMPASATLASHTNPAVETVGSSLHRPASVCFIGIENKSIEELADFKDQLYERIDAQVNGGANFRTINRRMVVAALEETRLRSDSLYLPANRAAFSAVLGRQGSPVDYLLYANITSGTTDRNSSTQRDYLLTLEMVNVRTGDQIKESATISKGYHNTRAGKWWQYGLGMGDS